MTTYQIGTEEDGGCVGSRASRSNDLATATEETREYSRARHVKSAWLREYVPGPSGKMWMGDVIVTFRKGKQV